MAEIKQGKFKGTQVELCQWCNDWMSVNMPDGEAKIYSPAALWYTEEEFWNILHSKDFPHLKKFYNEDVRNGRLTFVKIKWT